MKTDRERRNKARLKLTGETFAYVQSVRFRDIVAAKLIDISDMGVRIRHMGGEISPDTPVMMDIVLPSAEACMQRLAGIIIYDHGIKSESEAGRYDRYCGIGFRGLTISQKSYVQYLLDHFRKGEDAQQ